MQPQGELIRGRFPKALDKSVQVFEPRLHTVHQVLVLQSRISTFIFVYVRMQISFCINISQTCTGLTDTVAILLQIFQLSYCMWKQSSLPLLQVLEGKYKIYTGKLLDLNTALCFPEKSQTSVTVINGIHTEMCFRMTSFQVVSWGSHCEKQEYCRNSN